MKPQVKSPEEIQEVHDLLIKVITSDDKLDDRSQSVLLSASQALGWVLNDPRSDFESFLAIAGILKE